MVVDFFVLLWNAPVALFSSLVFVALLGCLARAYQDEWLFLVVALIASVVLACVPSGASLIMDAARLDHAEIVWAGGWEKMAIPLKACLAGGIVAAIGHVVRKLWE